MQQDVPSRPERGRGSVSLQEICPGFIAVKLLRLRLPQLVSKDFVL